MAPSLLTERRGMLSPIKSKIDDGFYPELVDGACFLGYMGIPQLMDLRNTEIPVRLIPFSRAKSELNKGNTRGYVHFYEFDEKFSGIITNIDAHIDLLKHFDGAITPDCTLLTGQVNCLQATNTYFNRAVGFRLQKAGIPVICQIRWSDEKSFDYCFLGARKREIVAIGSYGTIKTAVKKAGFRRGLIAMLDALEPTDVLVYGPMPESVFGDLQGRTRFHHFDDWMTSVHKKLGE